MKQFKLVFVNNHTYELWLTGYKGEWLRSGKYFAFSTEGDPLYDRSHERPGMVTDMVLWVMDDLVKLGYEFLGIEES